MPVLHREHHHLPRLIAAQDVRQLRASPRYSRFSCPRLWRSAFSAASPWLAGSATRANRGFLAVAGTAAVIAERGQFRRGMGENADVERRMAGADSMTRAQGVAAMDIVYYMTPQFGGEDAEKDHAGSRATGRRRYPASRRDSPRPAACIAARRHHGRDSPSDHAGALQTRRAARRGSNSRPISASRASRCARRSARSRPTGLSR